MYTEAVRNAKIMDKFCVVAIGISVSASTQKRSVKNMPYNILSTNFNSNYF